MYKNTINERKKTDIGTGVQMSKYFNKSPALQGNQSELRPKLIGHCMRYVYIKFLETNLLYGIDTFND